MKKRAKRTVEEPDGGVERAHGISSPWPIYKFIFELSIVCQHSIPLIEEGLFWSGQALPYYGFWNEDKKLTFGIVQNRLESEYLVPKLKKGANFLLLCTECASPSTEADLLTHVSSLSQVQSVFEIPLSDLKNLYIDAE